MSKQNNLTDFLTDVANAIRVKKGSTDLINPQNFSAEIAALSGGLEVIDMTETTATIEPNKVYVWGMVESLDITLGASTDESDFFTFRFRCSKPTMTSVTVNSAIWAEDTELDAQGKPVLDLGSWYQCEIKGGTSALYVRLAHYIPFADSNVEAVLLAKGVGDGLGVTYKDAAKVTSISTWFNRNTVITAFSEFANFSGIDYLQQEAFYKCSSLKKITLPAGVTSLGDHSFDGCSSLTEITLPAGLTNIGSSSFRNCSSLKKITLPAEMINLWGSTFRNCSSLAEITLSAGLKQIDSYEFRSCSSLAEITLPDTLTKIGSYAFYGCSLLARVLNLENTKVTSINNNTFSNCSSLIEITLPSEVTSIGRSAFEFCSLLARVVNLENTKVTSIGNRAFYSCRSLTEITLPASLTSIGNDAFNYCSSLQYIRIEATTPPTLESAAIPSTIGAIYVPDESVAAYQAATNWSSFASKIKGISEMPAE